jgi:hypothetical protein
VVEEKNVISSEENMKIEIDVAGLTVHHKQGAYRNRLETHMTS